MTNRDDYGIRIVWRNSTGGELDSQPARNDVEVKEILIKMISDGTVAVGDTFSIEEI